MADTKQFFLAVTQRIFSNWTALKMAVEHGMGPKERAVDFCPYVVEVMFMNEGLNSSDIACELEHYMDEEFNTELEDGSTEQVAEELLRFYRYCVERNENLAVTEMEKLPPLQTWIASPEPIRTNRDAAVRQEEDSGSSESEEDGNGLVEGEWTTVRRDRRR